MSRILHTADWHLGARLIDHDRYEEHARFLAWLLEQIDELRPDWLIIAGDIFDSANPPQQALSQYYDFLAGAAKTPTQVLVLGGNHDSALLLNAPRGLLSSLKIHVIGSVPENPGEALFDLGDAVLCAVPYLRERDVRRAAAGQSFEEVAAQMREGIASHYQRVLESARVLAQGRPVIATGHLTAIGTQSSESERAIQIGNLGAVEAACFQGFAYVALGHLHRPQTVGGLDHIRYSGSPVALSFDETDVPKQVLLITTTESGTTEFSPIPIPCSRRLLRITCRLDALRARLAQIVPNPDELAPWLELTIEDGADHPDLELKVREAASLDVAILKIIAPHRADPADAANAVFQGRALAEIRPEEVFGELLRRKGIEAESDEGKTLAGTFAELLTKMQEVVPA